MSKSHRIATLAKTVLIEAIPIVDGNDVRLRVEIFSWSDHEYSCQVSRLDTYRVKPTFYDELADEEFLVLDSGIDWHHLRAATPDELLILLFENIERQLGVKIDRPEVPPIISVP